jgi:hypothetical protein
MARVFTINILFKGRFYLAEVSFNPDELNRSFFVRYLDEEINSLIHGRKIVINFTNEQTLINMEIMGEELLENTKEAINTYLYQYQD